MLRSFVSHRALIAAILAAGLALPAVAHDTEADAPRKKEYFQPGANHAGTPAATGGSVPRYSGLGGIAMAVTTASPEAQAYFDQGLALAWGFNHAEARRSFQAAQALDPSCAMCFWGSLVPPI